MKLLEFRKSVAATLDDIGRFLPVYIHDKKKIYLKVVYDSNKEDLVDYIYIDSKKKRIFFVGKSQERRDKSFFFNKRPQAFSIDKFYKWATAASNKRDEYETYFAWNYEHKDEELFDYAPLSGETKVEPSAQRFEYMAFEVDSSVNSLKMRARSLRESIKRLEEAKKNS